MQRIFPALFITWVTASFSCAGLWAQATAQISGTVRDQSGAVLPGVEVTASQRNGCWVIGRYGTIAQIGLLSAVLMKIEKIRSRTTAGKPRLDVVWHRFSSTTNAGAHINNVAIARSAIHQSVSDFSGERVEKMKLCR